MAYFNFGPDPTKINQGTVGLLQQGRQLFSGQQAGQMVQPPSAYGQAGGNVGGASGVVVPDFYRTAGYNSGSTGSSSGGGRVGYGAGQAGMPDYGSMLGQQNQMGIDAINAEYQSEQDRLNQQEAGVRQNYGDAIGQAQNYYPQFEQLVRQEQANKLGQLQQVGEQRKKESVGQMAQARNLLNELQRREAARFSVTGGYSSSVADAAGEAFGRKANESLSTIQGRRDVALQDVQNKMADTETFYSNKLLEGKQKYDTYINGLKQQFLGQLDAIANARGQSEAAKRAATMEAWRSYTNNKISLDQQMRQYQDQMSMWKAQMGASAAQASGYDSGAGSVRQTNSQDVLSALRPQAGGSPNIGSAIGMMPNAIRSGAQSLNWEDILRQGGSGY